MQDVAIEVTVNDHFDIRTKNEKGDVKNVHAEIA